MTYNFDPDRWYENQRRALDAQRDRGELDDAAYQAAVASLEARYDEMLARLNKPFEVGRGADGPGH
jgi:hypothetical protein